MADVTGSDAQDREPLRRPPGRRRWWRWTLAVVGVLVVLVVIAAVAVTPQAGPPPLAVPADAAAVPAGAGSVDGAWVVGPGSVAGFRVRQTFFGRDSDVVGRTETVTGTAAVAEHRVTSAAFTIDLTTVKVKGETQPQFVESLDARRYQTASFVLGQPIALSPELDAGGTVTATASG